MIEAKSLSHLVYEHLLPLILTGELAAGSSLREGKLAAELGVSRTPIREALHRLAEYGVVEIRANYGAVVRRLGVQELVDFHQIREALEEPVGNIVAAVKETLDRTPPELAGDIMDRGITLAGGGALLQGLEQRLRDECQMPCQLAESPLTCVAVGSGISLEEFEAIHRAGKNRNGARQRV